MSRSPFTDTEQFQCLNILDYVLDLFTYAGKEEFTRAEVLVILNHVKHDPDLFDPEMVVAQEEATAE